jgi:tetratricopeptide (TPR) repeat protein
MKSLLNLFVFTFFIGCTSSSYKKEAIALNNKATQLFRSNPDSALVLFDQAITIDSSYHVPIQNKANLLIDQRRYEEAFVAVEQLLAKKEYPEALQMKGMLLDKLGKTPQEAQVSYQKALSIYQNRLDTLPKNKIAIENMSIAMTYFLLGDTAQAKKLILENKTEPQGVLMGDSILKYLDNKQRIIDIIIK